MWGWATSTRCTFKISVSRCLQVELWDRSSVFAHTSTFNIENMPHFTGIPGQSRSQTASRPVAAVRQLVCEREACALNERVFRKAAFISVYLRGSRKSDMQASIMPARRTLRTRRSSEIPAAAASALEC